MRRVVPVIEGLAAATRSLPEPPQLSIDTSKAAVAQAALAAGATLVNDVSALRADPEMARCRGRQRRRLLSHAHARRAAHDATRTSGLHTGMSSTTSRPSWRSGSTFAVGAGVAEQRVLLDPGIGFGKTVAHNLELLRRLEEIVALGRPVVIGTSRKSFLGALASCESDCPRAREGGDARQVAEPC